MLCSDLLLKDMKTFKRDYDTYYLKQKTFPTNACTRRLS